MLHVVRKHVQLDVKVMEILKEFIKTTISNNMQLSEDDEIEHQSNVEGNQYTFKDEETMLDNAPRIQGSRLFDYMDLGVGKEMQDDGMDCFVMQEGPRQMINLLLEEQTNNLVFREFDSDEFEDYFKCVDVKELKRNEIFFNKRVKENYPIVFQLDSGHNKKEEKTTPTTSILDENNGKWEKIRSKIMTIKTNLEKRRLDNYGRC